MCPQHTPTNTLCWVIHRPAKRGWYIRIRSPTFAPGIFIPLIPVPTRSPHYSEAALSFHSQTNIPTLQDPHRDSISSIHSYPPTPPALIVRPPSPGTVRAKLEQIPKDNPERRHRKPQTPSVSTQMTHFVLTPHSTQVAHPASNSILARALSALKNSTPSHSNSFTLSRIPSISPLASPPPYASTSASAETTHLSLISPPPPLVLTFHDRTPVLTIRSLTGLLEIQTTEEQLLGIDTSFWIAVALTYLDFLEEREVSLVYGITNRDSISSFRTFRVIWQPSMTDRLVYIYSANGPPCLLNVSHAMIPTMAAASGSNCRTCVPWT